VASVIITGAPGTAYTNNTDKILWQYNCHFGRSCARCISLHNQIGPYWPIPLHDGCNCRSIPVKPGDTAAPFIDYRKVVADLPPAARRHAMGASNWRLVESGLAKWSDVVQPGRIRDFREVVDRLGFGVDQMVKAGIAPHQARSAWDAVHTVGHQAASAERAAIVQGLRSHGLTDARIVAEVSKLLAGRIGIDGPSGPGGIGPAPGPAPAPIAPRPVGPPSRVSAGPGVDLSRAVEHAAKILGRPVTASDLADLAGAPPDATAKVILSTPSAITIEVRSRSLNATRHLRSDGRGLPFLENEKNRVREADRGKGLGSEAFAAQVEAASRLGVDRIEAYAAQSAGFNGYYTWPRLGFDAPLPPSGPGGPLPGLPPGLAGARRLSDLMATPEGRAWWKAHGISLDVAFDPRPGGASRLVWDAYIAARREARP